MTASERFALTGAGAGLDSVWEQKKPEAKQKAKKRADSHLLGARIVRHLLLLEELPNQTASLKLLHNLQDTVA